MIINHVRLGRTVTFVKYLTSAVSLIFLPKTLTLNKIRHLPSSLLRLAELVVTELKKTISKKVYQCLQKSSPLHFFTNNALSVCRIWE